MFFSININSIKNYVNVKYIGKNYIFLYIYTVLYSPIFVSIYRVKDVLIKTILHKFTRSDARIAIDSSFSLAVSSMYTCYSLT